MKEPKGFLSIVPKTCGKVSVEFCIHPQSRGKQRRPLAFAVEIKYNIDITIGGRWYENGFPLANCIRDLQRIYGEVYRLIASLYLGLRQFCRSPFGFLQNRTAAFADGRKEWS